MLSALFSSWLVCSALGCHGEVSYARARVTAYTSASSCHYPDGRGHCLTASGVPVAVGQAACPRDIPFGSVATISGREYVCADRYARWLDTRYPQSPTFDLFVTACSDNTCGRTFEPVTVWIEYPLAR